jgi:hypothetical protein
MDKLVEVKIVFKSGEKLFVKAKKITVKTAPDGRLSAIDIKGMISPKQVLFADLSSVDSIVQC